MSKSADEVIQEIQEEFDLRFKSLKERVSALTSLKGDELFKKWGIRGGFKVSMNIGDIIALQGEVRALSEECDALEEQLNGIQGQPKKNLEDWIGARKISLEINKKNINRIIKRIERRLKGKRPEDGEAKEGKEILELKSLDEKNRREVSSEYEKEYNALEKYTDAVLKNMTDEEFSDFRDRVSTLSTRVGRLLASYDKEKIPDELIKFATKIDHLSAHIIEMEKERSIFSKAYYSIVGTPAPKLGGKYWLLTKGEALKALKLEKMKAIEKEWQDKITAEFEASDKATPTTKAGIEGRRWGTTYLLTREQAEKIRRKKKAYDEIRATKEACQELGLVEQEAYETMKHVVKTTAVTAQKMVEESVVTTGQAVMVGLGGPAYAAFILAWNATFAALEKGGNLLSRGFATLDAFAEESIMELFGKVAKNPDGSVDWSSGDKIAKNIALGFLHSLRAVSWVPKIVTSGIAAGTRSVNDAIGDFTRKNIIPLLGVAGTVIAAYFLAVTLVSVFTFGIPLAITVVGLAAAAIGAGIATYMRTKSKAQESINLKLSPEEEAMLMRYDYQQKIKEKQQRAPEIAAAGLQITAGSDLKQRAEAVRIEVNKLESRKPPSSEALNEQDRSLQPESPSSPTPLVFRDSKSEQEAASQLFPDSSAENSGKREGSDKSRPGGSVNE